LFCNSSQTALAMLERFNQLALQIGAANARKQQEIVDQLAHALRRFANPAQVVVGLRIEFVGVVLKQQLAESIDAAKRGAQSRVKLSS